MKYPLAIPFWRSPVPKNDYYVEDGKMYYTNFNRSYYTRDKNAEAYIARIDRDINESRAARGKI